MSSWPRAPTRCCCCSRTSATRCWPRSPRWPVTWCQSCPTPSRLDDRPPMRESGTERRDHRSHVPDGSGESRAHLEVTEVARVSDGEPEITVDLLGIRRTSSGEGANACLLYT